MRYANDLVRLDLYFVEFLLLLHHVMLLGFHLELTLQINLPGIMIFLVRFFEITVYMRMEPRHMRDIILHKSFPLAFDIYL